MESRTSPGKKGSVQHISESLMASAPFFLAWYPDSSYRWGFVALPVFRVDLLGHEQAFFGSDGFHAIHSRRLLPWFS